MEKFSTREKALEYLRRHPGKEFTAQDLAEWICNTYPKECEEKCKNSVQNRSMREIITREAAHQLKRRARIYRDVAVSNKDADGNKQTRRFRYIGDGHQATAPAPKTRARPSATSRKKEIPAEVGLYPKLASFLRDALGVEGKRIDEKKASNRGGRHANKWLFPDVVGMEDLSQNWADTIKKCVQQYGDKKVKLWSFEVKREVTRSNVREYFFQAVSNSSWANYGYLVAVELEGEAEKELQILSALHGIGFIRLDIKSPQDSRVIIHAHERVDVDWNTANRIAEANKDFANYMDNVRRSLHNWVD